MRKEKTITVEGSSYRITQCNAAVGLEIVERLQPTGLLAGSEGIAGLLIGETPCRYVGRPRKPHYAGRRSRTDVDRFVRKPANDLRRVGQHVARPFRWPLSGPVGRGQGLPGVVVVRFFIRQQALRGPPPLGDGQVIVSVHPSVRLWLWRPVEEGFASLHEVQTLWSLSDLLDAHLVIEARIWAKLG